MSMKTAWKSSERKSKMNEKARKYIDLFRKVKIATAATVDEEEHNGFEIIEKGLPGRCGKTPA